MKIKKNTIKTIINFVITVIVLLFMAFMFEQGLFKWGVWGFIGFSVLIGGFRIWKGWGDYMRVIDMGADQLKIMAQLRKQDKEQEKKKE